MPTGHIQNAQTITGHISKGKTITGTIAKPSNRNSGQNIERTVTLAVTGTALKVRSCTVRQLEFET